MSSSEETAAILKQLKIQGEVLQAILKNQATAASTKANTESTSPGAIVSHNITLEAFDPDEEDFSSYKERLENFFTMRGMTGQSQEHDSAKRSVLLGCLKRDQFKQLSALTVPHKPSEKSYNELVEILEKRFDPISNVHTERHRFLSRVQTKSESLTSYISALKMIGQKCQWVCHVDNCKAQIDSIFQAQFIRGIRDNYIREKILVMKTETSLEKTLETALALEAAHKQNVEEYTSDAAPTQSTNVHKVSMHDNNSPYFRSRSRSRSSSHHRNRNTFHKNGSTYREKSTTKERLQKLGIQDLQCLRCGKYNHTARQCRVNYRQLKCKSCNNTGHVESVCIRTKANKNQVNMVYADDEEFDVHCVNHTSDQYKIYDVLQNSEDKYARKIYVSVRLHNKVQKFELDTGSAVSILSRHDFEQLNLHTKITECPNIRFRAYNKQLIVPEGYVHIPITYNNKTIEDKLYIVSENFSPILGRIWIRKLDIIDIQDGSSDDENEIYYMDTEHDIYKKFPQVFTQQIGKIPNVSCTLKLKPDAKPTYRPPRPVPYALISKVDEELDSLEKQGIIEKTEYSQWGTPLVIVPKSNDTVRICADYRMTVNNQLEPAHYPIPRVEELFTKLHGSTYFCVLDVYKAYLHVSLDEQSSLVAGISTHRGTYKVNRLFFGIATGPSVFHGVMAPILNGLEGCVAYFDDIVIHGKTEEECYTHLIACLQRLQLFDIHLNKDKCKFFVRKIRYLGHIISEKGLEKDPEKVKALVHAPEPTDVNEVRSFLGMVNYYTKFIPHASTLLYPLNSLLKKSTPFKWTEECDRAFKKVKEEIASDKVLITYSSKLPLVLECDASPYGISGILCHKIDGNLKPISFISRTLTAAERNYSHLDKEATAIFWSVKKFYQYLYGVKFTLITDNRPLQSIFNPNKHLPSITALRLTRYALFLRQFDYNIQYRAGSQNQVADYFSRAPLKLLHTNVVDESFIIHESAVNLLSTAQPTAITSEDIVRETTRDSELNKLRTELQSGKCTSTEFSLHNGVIMRGQRVVIPESIQQYVLQELHQTHCGIVKMKALARSTVYWKNIDKDIESLVRSCPACVQITHVAKKVPLHPWEKPNEIWQRIHADFAGPIEGKQLFIVVDALTKWVEVEVFHKAPTSSSTISALRRMFAGNGIPNILVTDNASIFKSEEFEQFCKVLGIAHRTSAPYHPASNGQAERTVQTFKRKLKAMLTEEPKHLEKKIQHILFHYRNTPIAEGKSPAELHVGRTLRSKLHMLQPSTRSMPPDPVAVNTREFQVGQRVLSRHYLGADKWKTGTITERLGRIHYSVKLDNGPVVKRHVNQLKFTEYKQKQDEEDVIQPEETPKKVKTVTFTLPPVQLIPTRPPPTNNSTSSIPVQPRRRVRPVIDPESLRRSTRTRNPVERLNYFIRGG
ncbi:hypothetical protein M8J77_015290 [Diaphorina citri]|nr:hypothetical protein M8J77_015290 [Diaphorina citri]